MSHNAFTAAEICRIIKASKGTGLKVIEYGSLKISFHTQSPQEDAVVEFHKLAGQPAKPAEIVPGEIIADNELQEVIDEIAQENFMIQDPAAYERQLLDDRVYSEDQGEPSGRGTEARRT